MMEKQEKLNINTEKVLEIREQETHHKIKNIPMSDIPESKGGIKDFVLMEHMRLSGYSEATIWLILYKLEWMGKIDLRDGEWKSA